MISQALLVLAFLLSIGSPAFAQHISAPKPKLVHPDHQVWVLMLMENAGATVSVGGVFRSKEDALRFAETLPAPISDRVVLPVPSMLTRKGGAK